MNDPERAFKDVLNVLKNFEANQSDYLEKSLNFLEIQYDLKPEKVRAFYQSFLLQSRQVLHNIIVNLYHKASKNAVYLFQCQRSNGQQNLTSKCLLFLQNFNKIIKIQNVSLQTLQKMSTIVYLWMKSLYFLICCHKIFQRYKRYKSLIIEIPENEKYTLLKISNAILKRLSRTHEVEMRGKIHIFLTKLLPICHRSGTQKKTVERDFSFQESHDDHNQQNNDVPFTLYKNFWSLQKYLNHPENLLNFQVALTDEVLIEDGFDNLKQKDKVKKDPKSLELIRLNNIQTLIKIISKILFYFDQNPLSIQAQENNKRFPKYLTKYSLFQNQLNDVVFRKIFLTQVLLFCSTQKLHKSTFKNEEEKQIFNQLEQDCKNSIKVLFQEEPIIENLIKTESTWFSWRELKGNFEQAPCDEIFEVFRLAKSQNFSDHFCLKSQEKKKQLISKVYEDLRYRQTDSFLNLIQGQRCFKVETTGVEPGMNYYLNDVLTEMDPKSGTEEREKCKNLKDYAWKAVRVISKFLLKEMKTNNTINSKILDLEELTKQIKDSMEKHIQSTIIPINVLPMNVVPINVLQNLQLSRPEILPALLPNPAVNILPIQAYNSNGQSGLLRAITITPRMSQQDQDHNQHRRSS